MGTRVACATESIAHPAFKKACFRGNARDAVASVQVDPRLPVIPVRALKNKGTEEFTAKQVEVAKLLDDGSVDMGEAQLQIEHYWAGALRRAVRERFGNVPCLFLLGCSGDIRPDFSRKRVAWLPRSRFNWQESGRPIEAAIGGAQPDDFVLSFFACLVAGLVPVPD